MAWVGFDRAAEGAEGRGEVEEAARFRAIADEIHAEVCARGYNAELGAFTQYYGSTTVDASLLTLPLVGFLPSSDPRIAGTIAAIERELSVEGLLLRYQTDGHDGLEGHEGVFLICSFWLVEVHALQGRMAEAEALFDRLLGFANDLGLLSEEVDVATGEMLGNFPQAFSHIGLVMAAVALSRRRAGEQPLLHQ